MTQIFRSIEELHEGYVWGSFLDAGTGWASLRWALSLETESLTAVTGSQKRLSGMKADFSPQLRPQDRLLVGNWVNEEFLAGESFQTVLVDYLMGALDRFAPYYQTRLIPRLKPLVGGRLIFVGLEPYPEASEGEEDGQLLQELVALRDSSILLSGDRPHREFPRWWVREQLENNGFRILEEKTYPILYGKEFVEAELGVARECLKLAPPEVRSSLQSYQQSLRKRLLKRVSEKPLSWGNDYLIVAEKAL